jgi:outer membrane protein assembly factor BamD (BamD/ComL family)
MIYSLKIEQAKIKKEIDEFYNSFKAGPNKGNLKQAKEFFGKIKAEIKNLFDDDVLNSLKQFEAQYNEAKKETVSEIAQVSMEALNNLESGEISKAIEIFEKIIKKLEFNNKTLTGA